MARHFRNPSDAPLENAPQTPHRGNPRARYQHEQAQTTQPEEADQSTSTPEPRRTLEPLDSFPTYRAPSMDDDSGSQDAPQPIERPLPYGNAAQGHNGRLYDPSRAEHSRGQRHHSRRRRHWPWVVLAAVIAVVLAIGGSALALLNDAKALKSEVSAYSSQVSALSDAVMGGDGDQAALVAQQLSDTARAMAKHTDTPLWALGSLVPVYGRDVAQARELTQALEDLTDNGLAPAVGQLKGHNVQDLLADGGAINLDLLSVVSTALETLKEPLQRTADTVNEMQPFHVQSIEDTMGSVRNTLSSVDTLVQQADDILPALPSMLGANGQTRTYLFMALSNSEARAAGGFPGSIGTISVTNGQISMGDFSGIPGRVSENFPEVSDAELAFADSGLLDTPGSATLTPEFSRAAQIFMHQWTHTYGNGQTYDGVIAMDPVFLQSLLKLTGGFTANYDGTEVDGTNAAKELLNGVYWKYTDNAQMDGFFASVASQAFSQVLDHLGDVDLFKLGETLSNSIGEHRLQMWMANKDDEAAITKLGASGDLSTDTKTPELGVFFNDYTWSKIDWYLQVRTETGTGTKNADGSTTYDVTTTYTNTMTTEEAQAAPPYITGGNPSRRELGDMVTMVQFVAPAGGSLSDFSSSYAGFAATQTPVYGFDAWKGQIQILPGESVTVSYKVTTATDATEPLTVRQTPLGNVSE